MFGVYWDRIRAHNLRTEPAGEKCLRESISASEMFITKAQSLQGGQPAVWLQMVRDFSFECEIKFGINEIKMFSG